MLTPRARVRVRQLALVVHNEATRHVTLLTADRDVRKSSTLFPQEFYSSYINPIIFLFASGMLTHGLKQTQRRVSGCDHLSQVPTI
jgi:hypothetical protein